MGRLYSSAYYALRDTRTPLRFAVLRVAVTTVLGYVCAKHGPGWLGIDPLWGVAGLTASAGVAGWIEFALLRRGLNQKLGSTPSPARFIAKLWLAALIGVAAGTAVRFAPLPSVPMIPAPIVRAAATLGPFGVIYLVASATFADEARRLLRRLSRAG